jgi:putative acetyltransferase
MLIIREARDGDGAAIRRVNELAFGRRFEADLVERLQQSGCDSLSLVADEDDVVGHILFTPVVVQDGDQRTALGMGLAPMSVLPGRQREGIGSRLIEQGLDHLRQRGCPFVVVIGYPAYYPRFGFERASAHSLACQWPAVPDEAFMIRVLDPGAVATLGGLVTYRDEFSSAASQA